MVAHKELRWAEDAVACGKQSLAALEAKVGLVKAEILDLDKRISGAMTKVDGAKGAIDDIKYD